MSDIWLKPEVEDNVVVQLQGIIEHRAALVEKYSLFIETLDESDVAQWQHIVAAAREGGVGKDTLCQAFSCAWSTVLRWQAGRNAPGQFARTAMKAKLIELLDNRRREEVTRLESLHKAKGKIVHAA